MSENWSTHCGAEDFQIHKLAFKIIHSSMKLLPTWKTILKELDKAVTLIPQDVAHCWNSTFNLLRYVQNHQKAIDKMNQCCDLGLRKFELDNEE